jgi:hypothetical protein
MKSTGSLFFIVCLFANTAVFSYSQVVGYDGPWEEDTFFPIGFSSDGNKFAYGWFEITQMISNGSAISIKVQDLVTDKIIYQFREDWDEGNVGPEAAGYYPTDAKEAWDHIAEEVNKKFAKLDIRGGAGEGVLPLPVGDLGLNVEIREGEGEPGYGIIAYSENLGEKMIHYSPDMYIGDMQIVGYVWNPSGTRIGVIMNTITGTPYSDYWVIGCHVSSGFNK